MNVLRAHQKFHGNPARVALITGGSDGIGAACVQEFVASGWNVSSLALPGRDLDRQSANGVLTIAGDVTSRRFARRPWKKHSAAMGASTF